MTGNQEWILKRNCSITPRQLLLAYGVMCGMSLAVAGFFLWLGAWYVLGFSVLEMGAVGCAFLFFARHATDREYIALGQEWLWVELIEAEQAVCYQLNARTARIQAPAAHYRLIAIEASGRRVEIGRFLTTARRRQFAQELDRALDAQARSGFRRPG